MRFLSFLVLGWVICSSTVWADVSPDEIGQLRQAVQQLTQTVQQLNATVQTQQQRIAQLESARPSLPPAPAARSRISRFAV